MTTSGEQMQVAPPKAAQGLVEVGRMRAQALSKGAANLPADQYSGDFAAVVQAAWMAHAADLGAHIATGLGIGTAAVTTIDGTEAANASNLGA